MFSICFLNCFPHVFGDRLFITDQIGHLWDTYGEYCPLNVWNLYLEEPWNNWSIGGGSMNTVPFCTPNQNCQENWHGRILKERIPGMFKGSTEHVMQVALRQLIELDATMIPSVLQFHVPAIPRRWWRNAKRYGDSETPRIISVMEGGREHKHAVHYILHRRSPIKKFNMKVVNAYKCLLQVADEQHWRKQAANGNYTENSKKTCRKQVVNAKKTVRKQFKNTEKTNQKTNQKTATKTNSENWTKSIENSEQICRKQIENAKKIVRKQ